MTHGFMAGCTVRISGTALTIIHPSSMTPGSMAAGGTPHGITIGDGTTTAGAGVGDTTIGIPAGTPAGAMADTSPIRGLQDGRTAISADIISAGRAEAWLPMAEPCVLARREEMP